MSDDERYLDDGADDRELLATLRESAEITFETPSPGTWDRIAAQLGPDATSAWDDSGPGDATAGLDTPEPPAPPAPAESAPTARRVSRRALWWGAAGVAAGAALTVAGVRLAESGRVIAETVLRTLDTNLDEGRAKIRERSGTLFLEIDLPHALSSSDGYVEVWLIHRDLKELVSVGIYTGGAEESFPMSRDVLNRGFVVVDLSREHFDGNAGHSGDSLLRGQLPL
ncbi:MAG: anti-sigma factor [Propionibacteriaceae bacterium]